MVIHEAVLHLTSFQELCGTWP